MDELLRETVRALAKLSALRQNQRPLVESEQVTGSHHHHHHHHPLLHSQRHIPLTSSMCLCSSTSSSS